MKRLILTIISGIMIMSLAGCVGYRQHHPWHGRRVVVVNRPKHPPMPPAHPRRPHRHHAPPPIPRRHHRF
ncbi:MAG: hypothetical protein ACYSTT_04580 [Planctomycetota bacterium]